MNNEEKILSLLEILQKQISSLEKTTNDRFESIEKSTDQRFNGLEKLITKENELTRSELELEIENVYEEVKDLKDNLNIVEQITAKNWLDITKLKSVK